MNSYLIEYNGKIIGLYSDYNNAELFILSCYQNNLMTKDAYIHCYKMNSCYKVNTNIVTINNNSSSDCDMSLHVLTQHSIPESPTVSLNTKSDKINDLNPSADKTLIESTITPEIKLENEKRINEIEKEKHDLIHNMNLLKMQQNKITEIKQVFDVDLKLFNQFKLAKETDNGFIIPELFVNKYKIMNNLFLKDKLDWSNYYNEMKINNKDNNIYNKHFITNSYENSFINNKKLDKTNKIEEELYLDI
jgi:hypothetical protein